MPDEDDLRLVRRFLSALFLALILSPFFIRLDFLCFESSESLDELSLDVELVLLLLLLVLLLLDDVDDDDELSLSEELDELELKSE